MTLPVIFEMLKELFCDLWVFWSNCFWRGHEMKEYLPYVDRCEKCECMRYNIPY